MKHLLFLLFASVLLLTTACEKDPYALRLEKFDVRWFDGDHTAGTLQPGDVIEFRMWARDNRGTELERFHHFVLEN